MPALREPLLALTLLSAFLAGCLEGEKKDVVDDVKDIIKKGLPPDFVDPLLLNHDHTDVKLHNLAYNMEELSHHPLGGSNLKSSGAHAVDVQNGWLFVATYGAQVDVDGGVWIFNLSNPAKPALTGRVQWPGPMGGDRSMEATDDGNWIVLGTEPADCAGHVNPFAPGIMLVDARDKARPQVVDYLPGSTHSLTIHRVKDDDYVFATYGLGGTNQFNVFKIDKTASPKPKLTGVGNVQIRHDSAAFDDPLLGIPILYSANVADLVAYDISNPAAPKKLGTWALTRDEAANHYVHAVSMQLVEGARILALESEDWRNNPSPVWILDATDFNDIQRIGNWTNPGKKAANAGQGRSTPTSGFDGQLTFSTHNPRLEDGIVYFAHYHGGIWALNVSNLAFAADPQIEGYYLPHDNNGGFVPRSSEGTYPKPNLRCGFELTQIPIVFDVEVQDGYVYAADLHTGLYTVKLKS